MLITLIAGLLLVCWGHDVSHFEEFGWKEGCSASAGSCGIDGLLNGSMMIQKISAHGKSKIAPIARFWSDAAERAKVLNGVEHIDVGLSSELSEAGYKQVLKKHSNVEMALFVVRLITHMKMKVVDDLPFHTFVAWYSGDKAAQNFTRMTDELTSISNRICAWVVPTGSQAQESGMNAPLTEAGYQTVATQRSVAEMWDFVVRVMSSMNLRIVDRGGATGFLHYHDCTYGAKSLAKLQEELLNEASKDNPWVGMDIANENAAADDQILDTRNPFRSENKLSQKPAERSKLMSVT